AVLAWRHVQWSSVGRTPVSLPRKPGWIKRQTRPVAWHARGDSSRSHGPGETGMRSGGATGVAAWIVALAVAAGASAAGPPTLTAGPYSQLLTTRSVTIVWNTSAPAVCAVRVQSPS